MALVRQTPAVQACAEARRPGASLRAALALWRGGLSAQLLTGICYPADSVMSSPITSLLVRQRKRRIQDMYTIENVKERARKVLVLTMSLAALAAMEYDCGLVRVRHQLTKTGIPRFVDSAWSCIKTSKEDANFLEFTALTLGAFHLLHAHFAVRRPGKDLISKVGGVDSDSDLWFLLLILQILTIWLIFTICNVRGPPPPPTPCDTIRITIRLTIRITMRLTIW
jgi:hypothetical protein